jgi:hypothetical protein
MFFAPADLVICLDFHAGPGLADLRQSKTGPLLMGMSFALYTQGLKTDSTRKLLWHRRSEEKRTAKLGTCAATALIGRQQTTMNYTIFRLSARRFATNAESKFAWKTATKRFAPTRFGI